MENCLSGLGNSLRDFQHIEYVLHMCKYLLVDQSDTFLLLLANTAFNYIFSADTTDLSVIF